MESFAQYMSRWFIFGNLLRPIVPFTANLLYWKPAQGDNVGDLLSLIIYKEMLKLGGVKRKIYHCTKRIVAIGSVLSFVGSGRTTVWGTGLMNDQCVSVLPSKKAELDIRAVRGPKTRECLINVGYDCPKVYGDPAILLPRSYNPTVTKEKGKIVIIPHHSRYEKYARHFDYVLDTYTSDWQKFVCEIKSAEKVISSSLHGIILSESYGIPCVWLNDIPDSPFKYEDYYLSTGRNIFPIANSIEEAMSMQGEINPRTNEMQRDLIDSFPYDLF